MDQITTGNYYNGQTITRTENVNFHVLIPTDQKNDTCYRIKQMKDGECLPPDIEIFTNKEGKIVDVQFNDFPEQLESAIIDSPFCDSKTDEDFFNWAFKTVTILDNYFKEI